MVRWLWRSILDRTLVSRAAATAAPNRCRAVQSRRVLRAARDTRTSLARRDSSGPTAVPRYSPDRRRLLPPPAAQLSRGRLHADPRVGVSPAVCSCVSTNRRYLADRTCHVYATDRRAARAGPTRRISMGAETQSTADGVGAGSCALSPVRKLLLLDTSAEAPKRSLFGLNLIRVRRPFWTVARRAGTTWTRRARWQPDGVTGRTQPRSPRRTHRGVADRRGDRRTWPVASRP